MSFLVPCHSCDAEYVLPDQVTVRCSEGGVITLRCRNCNARIRVEGFELMCELASEPRVSRPSPLDSTATDGATSTPRPGPSSGAPLSDGSRRGAPEEHAVTPAVDAAQASAESSPDPSCEAGGGADERSGTPAEQPEASGKATLPGDSRATPSDRAESRDHPQQGGTDEDARQRTRALPSPPPLNMRFTAQLPHESSRPPAAAIEEEGPTSETPGLIALRAKVTSLHPVEERGPDSSLQRLALQISNAMQSDPSSLLAPCPPTRRREPVGEPEGDRSSDPDDSAEPVSVEPIAGDVEAPGFLSRSAGSRRSAGHATERPVTRSAPARPGDAKRRAPPRAAQSSSPAARAVVATLAVGALGFGAWRLLGSSPAAMDSTTGAAVEQAPSPAAPVLTPPSAVTPAPLASASPSAAPSLVMSPNPLAPAGALVPAAAATPARPPAQREVSALPTAASSMTLLAAPPPETLAPPESVAPPIDTAAVRAALDAAAAQAASCRKDGDPQGNATVRVTFAPSGRVTSAVITGPPFAGTSTGGCIAVALRKARIPAFSGETVAVSKTVSIP